MLLNQTFSGNSPQAVFERNHSLIGAANCSTDSLLSGKLGLVLYYFSLYQAFQDESDADHCIGLLQEVMDTEEGDPASLTGPGFANGSAGLGFVLSLLNKHGLTDIDLADELHDLDKGMADAALYFIVNEERNDYLHGAFGILHYFTTRSSEPLIRTYIAAISEALCNKVIKAEEGSWFRSFFSDTSEKNRIDTGMAHGNIGMLLILLNVLQAVPVPQLHQVVKDGVRYLLSLQAARPENYSLFPFFINSADRGDRYFSSRLAWCYGDAGMLLLLYKAAFQLGIPEWKETADKLAVQVLARNTEESTMINDSHFCHGSAGLVQLYISLYGVTKNNMFHDAARFWLLQTIIYLDKETASDYYKGKENDLLNGLPGINLALLPFITSKELAWSHALLL